MIKAVSFDMWETLLFEQHGNDAQRRRLRCMRLAEALRAFGVELSLSQLFIAYDAMSDWFAKTWQHHRDVSVEDQLRFLVENASHGEIGFKSEWIFSLKEAYASAFFELPPRLNPHTHQVLHWLSDQKKHIGLICNTGRTPGFALRRFLIQRDVADFFEFMLFSDEVGIRKPEPRIFHLATTKFNVSPHQTVHIGDNPASDIGGAKAAGWQAILFSTKMGRDTAAEADIHSLLSISRRVDSTNQHFHPDIVIRSLDSVIHVIQDWDNKVY